MADNKEIIHCPACGKEMEKVFVKSANIYVDVCSQGCGGIYFDNREYYKFDEPNEDLSEITNILENKTFFKTDTEQERFCPCCGNKMVKNFSSFSNEIALDDCYNCGGKFLDFGELEKIRNQYETEEIRRKSTQEKILESPIYCDEAITDEQQSYRKSPVKKIYDSILNKIFFGE